MEMEQKVQILSFEDCIEAGLEGSILSAETEKMPDAIAEWKGHDPKTGAVPSTRLTNDERDLILAHFFFHATQEELARRYGVNQSSISRSLEKNPQ